MMMSPAAVGLDPLFMTHIDSSDFFNFMSLGQENCLRSQLSRNNYLAPHCSGLLTNVSKIIFTEFPVSLPLSD